MKNKILVFFVSFFIIFGFIFVAKYYALLNIVLQISKISDEMQSLQRANINIEVHFVNKLSLINFDKINQNLEIFDYNLQNLLKTQNPLFQTLNERLNDIEQNFEKRRQEIYKFNTINSETLALLKQFEMQFNELNNPQIYSQIYATIFSLNYREDQIVKKAGYAIPQPLLNDGIDSEFINTARKIAQNFILLNEIYENSKTGVSTKIALLLKDFSSLSDEYYLELKYMIALFFGLFLLSLIFALIINRKIYKLKSLFYGFENIINNGFSRAFLLNEKFEISYANEKYKNSQNGEILNQTPEILRSEEIKENAQNSLKMGKNFELEEFISEDKSGKILFEKVKFFPLKRQNSEFSYGCLMLDSSQNRDIKNALTKTKIELYKQAFIDKLTGLGNETALNQALDENTNSLLIYININNFTNLQFFYKSSVIDEIIKEFAKTLNLCIETNKIDAKVYHFMLDEFFVLYHSGDIGDDLMILKSYFENRIFNINSNEFGQIIAPLNISFGISTANGEITSKIYQATLAYKDARSRGENVGFYESDNETEQKYQQNQIVTNMIQNAINNDKIFVLTQPVFDISKNDQNGDFSVVYYEILVRLIDSKGKIRLPDEFLEIAKSTSLYFSITKIVIEQTFNLLEKFPERKFSINLSNLDITNNSLKEFFIFKAQKSKFCHNLCVEILESEEIKNYGLIENFIDLVQSFGCLIAIDDFGNGYSNFYRFLSLKVDYIKIDGSIISKITTDKIAFSLVKTISEFAKIHNYKVVAEQVDNIETIELLKQIDIKFIQGFILSKPISPDMIL